MRRAAVLAALLVAACIPSGHERRPEPPERPRVAETAKETLACHARLRERDVDFRPLPDRTFENGCSALGAVQLLDIGTPVTNLGAMTCPLAERFSAWVREAVQPAARAWLDSKVKKIESFGTYSCRSVNSRPGARLSEHGRANAVDIAAFVLDDGRRITVQAGWNGEDEDVRKFLRAIHQAGCRRFQVGLGPDSDSFHYNHLHFDMGRGPYCR